MGDFVRLSQVPQKILWLLWIFLCSLTTKNTRIPWKTQKKQEHATAILFVFGRLKWVKICVDSASPSSLFTESSKDVAEAVRCHPNASILAVPKPCLLTQKLCTPRSEPHTAVHTYAWLDGNGEVKFGGCRDVLVRKSSKLHCMHEQLLSWRVYSIRRWAQSRVMPLRKRHVMGIKECEKTMISASKHTAKLYRLLQKIVFQIHHHHHPFTATVE